MRIVLATGWYENYWGNWFTAPMVGGSEHIVMNLAREFVRAGHDVTLRVPYERDRDEWSGARVLSVGSGVVHADVAFCFDQFDGADIGDRRVLVACRSDPPPHADFDELIFLSRTHARLMGHPDRPAIGGGVNLAEYAPPAQPRIPRRVVCTSSPDRCPAASAIGRGFDFVHSYRPVRGLPPSVELSRPELVALQRSAQVLIYPLDPRRPSDFFSMAVLEAMAAGTPVVVSDADSMPELWSDAALVLPRPIDNGAWDEAVEELLGNRAAWRRHSMLGRALAERYDWPLVAARYLEVATA